MPSTKKNVSHGSLPFVTVSLSILKIFKTVTLGNWGESVFLPVCLFVYLPRGLSSHGECSLFLNERKASCNDPGSNSALATSLLSDMEQFF